MISSKIDDYSTTKSGDNFDPFANQYDLILENSLTLAGGDRLRYAKYKTDYLSCCIRDVNSPTILDFGCGDGTSLSLLRSNNEESRLFGIDISEASISLAKRKVIQECTFHSFSGLDIPHPSEFFNVVFAANVFHHIPYSNHNQVLMEIFRVMSPGGYLFIFEHNPLNPVTKKIFNDCVFDRDAKMLTPQYLGQQLQTSGFKKVKISYHLFFPRHTLFSPFLRLEPHLAWLPLGGQYCTWYSKP